MSLVSIPIFEPNFEAVDSHAGYLLALTSKQKIETENRCTYSLIYSNFKYGPFAAA